MPINDIPVTLLFSKSISHFMGIDMASLSPFLENDQQEKKLMRVIGHQLNATRQLYYKSERINNYFRDFEKPDLCKINLSYLYSFNHENLYLEGLKFDIECYGTIMSGRSSSPLSIYDYQYDNDFPITLTIKHLHLNGCESSTEYLNDDAIEILLAMQSNDFKKSRFFATKEFQKLIEISENTKI